MPWRPSSWPTACIRPVGHRAYSETTRSRMLTSFPHENNAHNATKRTNAGFPACACIAAASVVQAATMPSWRPGHRPDASCAPYHVHLTRRLSHILDAHGHRSQPSTASAAVVLIPALGKSQALGSCLFRAAAKSGSASVAWVGLSCHRHTLTAPSLQIHGLPMSTLETVANTKAHHLVLVEKDMGSSCHQPTSKLYPVANSKT